MNCQTQGAYWQDRLDENPLIIKIKVKYVYFSDVCELSDNLKLEENIMLINSDGEDLMDEQEAWIESTVKSENLEDVSILFAQ